MKNSRIRLATLLAVLLAAPGAAHAADRGWYLGAAYSDISQDFPDSTTLFFGDVPVGDEGYKIFVGYRVLDWLAVEADYGDFGDVRNPLDILCVTTPCPTDFRASTSAVSVSALGLYSIGQFDLFARAGLAAWNAESELHDSTGALMFSRDDSDTDFRFGAGGQYNFSRVIARLEYDRVEFGKTEADVWSLGLAFAFH